MSLARTFGVGLAGVVGQLVEVQADLSMGLPGLSFTGLADASVLESRDRIRAAVLNSGVAWPNRKITVALLPADQRKIGSRFDLSIAVAVLAASGEVPDAGLAVTAWIAELGLDGVLRPVRGVLPAVLAARHRGLARIVVAAANEAEAALVDGVEIRSAGTLRDVLDALTGQGSPLPLARAALPDDDATDGPDLADVRGQSDAKRGLEVAAAGGHHLSLVGPPGAGKTMLAERLPGLLPPLSEPAALEVTAVHSVAGRLDVGSGLMHRSPWQAPHHTASVAALVGGGSGHARPGAISLAHHGVLFLDEAPEFAPAALEALREPLESGEVVLHRAAGVVRYPARFLLALAANPCPCGGAAECVCAPQQRRRYRQRLSGPLLDRLDVRVSVAAVPHADLLGAEQGGEPTAEVAARVATARAAAAARWQALPWSTNGQLPGPVLRRPPWRLPSSRLRVVEGYLRRGEISARGLDRILRMAWTIADLAGRTTPTAADVCEALSFRTGQRGAWAA